ncbi:MAG: DUF3536 domain-containing protein [Fibrobacterales bacterium]
MAEKNPIYLTIHGHFYQPPRENPWTDEVEIQDSALPNHDWNDRIASQCYDANSASRLLNPYGKISKIINNYEYMSFNFGPTLMSWIRDQRPNTYKRIIEGDKRSAKRLNGHGNAIAQVYNHIIMPLANDRERRIQIEWGIRDFEFHFGRKPEGMWLAETAINTATVVDLIKAGIKYTILAPTQADAVREFANDAWYDVSQSAIDPTRPYRIYPKDEDGDPFIDDAYLDVFFYDGNLSSAVGFEHLLRNAPAYIDKIKGAFNYEKPDPQLISIATDGESYGHHEPFGDMCASYMFDQVCPKENIIPVNFGYFLEKNPPVAEVTLKNGLGEGTAWSCAHGVGRWYRNCGCTTGSPPEWNQEWRGPVRHAYNYLSKHALRVYDSEVKKISHTKPNELVIEYVEVLLQKDPTFTGEFLKKHLVTTENFEERATQLLCLLEMQKYTMFAYTSCGWFFGEVSGLEPVQNMKYARRSIELMSYFKTSFSIDKFLDFLDAAISNIDGRTGKQLYLDYTGSHLPTTFRVIAEVLYRELHAKTQFCSNIGIFNITVVPVSTATVKIYTVAIANTSTWERESLVVAGLKNQYGDDYFAFLPDSVSLRGFESLDSAIQEFDTIVQLYPDAIPVGFRDLFDDAFINITQELIDNSSRSILEDYKVFPKKHGMIMEILQQSQKPLDESIAVPLKMSMSAYVYDALEKALSEVTPEIEEEIASLKKRAAYLNLTLKAEWIEKRFDTKIEELMQNIIESPNPKVIQHITKLITLADSFNMTINKGEVENKAYPLYLENMKQFKNNGTMDPALVNLFSWLNFELPKDVYIDKKTKSAKDKTAAMLEKA